MDTNAMALLEIKRVVKDEGIMRTIKIVFNTLVHPDLRKRISLMRKIFKKHKNNMNAVAIVAQKI